MKLNVFTTQSLRDSLLPWHISYNANIRLTRERARAYSEYKHNTRARRANWRATRANNARDAERFEHLFD